MDFVMRQDLYLIPSFEVPLFQFEGGVYSSQYHLPIGFKSRSQFTNHGHPKPFTSSNRFWAHKPCLPWEIQAKKQTSTSAPSQKSSSWDTAAYIYIYIYTVYIIYICVCACVCYCLLQCLSTIGCSTWCHLHRTVSDRGPLSPQVGDDQDPPLAVVALGVLAQGGALRTSVGLYTQWPIECCRLSIIHDILYI